MFLTSKKSPFLKGGFRRNVKMELFYNSSTKRERTEATVIKEKISL